jgi:hypothetical protein
VHEIQELQFELPAPDPRCIPSGRRRKLSVALIVGVVSAFLGVLALSLLFAHPAGAAVLPGAGGSGPNAAVSNVVPVVTTSVDATSPAADSVAPVTSPAVTTLAPILAPAEIVLAPIGQPAIPTLPPVLQPVLQSVTPTIDPLMTTLSPVLARVVTGLVPPIGSITGAASGPALRPTQGSVGAERSLPDAWTNVRIAPVGPVPTPNPATPMPRFLAVTTPSTTDGSSSPSGSSSSAAQQPSGLLLLPAPMATGFSLGRAQSPQLLLDLRHSPPG